MDLKAIVPFSTYFCLAFKICNRHLNEEYTMKQEANPDEVLIDYVVPSDQDRTPTDTTTFSEKPS